MFGGQKVLYIWLQDENRKQNVQEDDLGNDGEIGSPDLLLLGVENEKQLANDREKLKHLVVTAMDLNSP